MLTYPNLFKPTQARLIITENCPLHCQMCSFWHEKSPEIPFELIDHWINECYKFGIKNISLGGGEPFIRPDLSRIVDKIKSMDMTCGITTSGWYVNNRKFPNVDTCEISIDGYHSKTHDKIRGRKDSWNRAFDLVNRIIRDDLCEIPHLNFALQRDNYKELSMFCMLIKKRHLKVSIIPISLHLSAQPALNEKFGAFDFKIMKDEIDGAYRVGNVVTSRSFLENVHAKMEGKRSVERCLTPYTDILIFTNGDVFPCGNIDKPMGNLSINDSLQSIYDDAQESRKDIFKGRNEYCNRKCVYPDIKPADLKGNVKLFMEALRN